MPDDKTLEQILLENNLTEDNLSPYVRNKYQLDDHVKFEPRPKPTATQRAGEKKIGDYISSLGFKVENERPVLVERSGRDVLAVNYPDFHIPEKDVYVEYLGMKGNTTYDDNTEKKRKTFDKNGMNYLMIEPEQLKDASYKKMLEDELGAKPKTVAGTDDYYNLLVEIKETIVGVAIGIFDFFGYVFTFGS